MSEHDPERLVREVSFAVEGDGRTIEARIVPYDVPTQVVDKPEYGGTGIPYLERWLPGAFSKQAGAANRVEVWMNFEHEPGIRGIIGHGVALREAPDALYGTFRVHPGADGDKALHMVNEGILTGLSVEAIPTRSEHTREGIVNRAKAILDKVSLCRGGLSAYQAAEVLAVREAPPEPEPDEPAPEPPPEPDPGRAAEVDAVLERLGVERTLKRAISRSPWNGAAARFSDEQYERSALICRAGDDPPKTRCSLPVLEPNGDVNTNALGAAAARLNQVTGINPAMRAAAARKLVRLYRQCDMEPPEMLRAMASR
jgi:HK97 family phage prohead protease